MGDKRKDAPAITTSREDVRRCMLATAQRARRKFNENRSDLNEPGVRLLRWCATVLELDARSGRTYPLRTVLR